MTTENNTNSETAANPATQTLFRFVSLRNPQLAKTDGNTKFIFRDKDHKGIFDTMLDSTEWAQSGKSKIDFLTDKIKSGNFDFTKIYRTEDDLKKPPFLNLYDLTKILIESGSLTSLQVNGFDSQSLNMPFLWDSLIYQILTQEDFYLKELLTQMLQTLHYIHNYDVFSTESNAKKKKAKEKEVSSAKVVIPDFLFVDSASMPSDNQSNVFTVGSSAVGYQDYISGGNANNISADTRYYPTESAVKRQEVVLAAYEKKQLEDLKKELSKTKTLYEKQYAQAYDLAYKDYQNLVKPLYDAYYQEISQVEVTFTEEMSQAEKDLALSQIEYPELPDFQFEFRKERDVTFLQNKLSETSLRSFVNLIGEYTANENITGRLNNGEVLLENIIEIGGNQFILPADENQSFGEMLETINEKLSDLDETIYQNSVIEKQLYASVGGVVIPVGANKTLENKTFSISMVSNEPNKWFGLLSFDDRSRSVVQANYTIQFSNGESISSSKILQSSLGQGVYEIFSGDINIPANYFNGEDFKITAEFLLSDGNTSVAEVTMSQSDPGFGVLNSKSQTSDISSNNFTPKNFGIKRLGIADYMKVEQSLHAYVPGEVSNIENVMASELRHKSSSKLLRTEDTVTTSTSTETEHVSDTTTASRNEMQTEVSKILQQDKDAQAYAKWSGKIGVAGTFEVGGSYANHSSKEDATRQMVAKSQEVTSRAMDRIVTKVSEERVSKIIQEFTEKNVHEYDNRDGNSHVTGVYRWVDKKMKNQIYNYGKRMMLEFMIPQPAKLHELALTKLPETISLLEKPLDPRESKDQPLLNAQSASEQALQYWADYYKVELTELPEKYITYTSDRTDENLDNSPATRTKRLDIPENYKAYEANIMYSFYNRFKKNSAEFTFDILKGDEQKTIISNIHQGTFAGNYVSTGININGVKEMRYRGNNGTLYITLQVMAKCELSDEFMLSWRKEQFNKIIAAYDQAVKEWEDKIKALQDEAAANAGNDEDTVENTQYYRQMEEVILKHNCISYLLQDYFKIGKKLYTGMEMKDFNILLNNDLDSYASLAKFMEQAFEWEIMSYNFYPYYWGSRDDWQKMYLADSMDPLFRSFLQAGMGRVVVTVKPGFEDAVNFFMATKKVWNGGEVPVIGDPLYLSIADEMRQPQGEKYGKAWITRVPTTLNILQAGTVGLEVTDALPITDESENLTDFEVPEDVVLQSEFQYSSDVKLGHSTAPTTLPSTIVN
ncbi:hypothetical protein J2X97_003130 [Epilithonimonas hungarica]|uniref:hypothetical protein n=1 Tax=Epilithonimonas hungarica TaxID=454006 RepID=UPI00277D3576|nr:hypothetical protein [Epilithonimonas hungarica]MDP9957461.1 hypothetical protein [Epilithonimonas hungarica]